MKYSGSDIFTGKIKNNKHEVRPEVEEAINKIKQLMEEHSLRKVEL